jgi:hypothetical protein
MCKPLFYNEIYEQIFRLPIDRLGTYSPTCRLVGIHSGRITGRIWPFQLRRCTRLRTCRPVAEPALTTLPCPVQARRALSLFGVHHLWFSMENNGVPPDTGFAVRMGFSASANVGLARCQGSHCRAEQRATGSGCSSLGPLQGKLAETETAAPLSSAFFCVRRWADKCHFLKGLSFPRSSLSATNHARCRVTC